jgi:hypothetical protein
MRRVRYGIEIRSLLDIKLGEVYFPLVLVDVAARIIKLVNPCLDTRQDWLFIHSGTQLERVIVRSGLD